MISRAVKGVRLFGALNKARNLGTTTMTIVSAPSSQRRAMIAEEVGAMAGGALGGAVGAAVATKLACMTCAPAAPLGGFVGGMLGAGAGERLGRRAARHVCEHIGQSRAFAYPTETTEAYPEWQAHIRRLEMPSVR